MVAFLLLVAIIVPARDHLGYDVINGTKTLNDMTKSWMHPEYYMLQQIWIFHLENLEDVLRGSKPRKLVDYASTSLPAKIAIEAVLRVMGEMPFVNVTVREALFDGYHDPLIDAVCNNT
ncbi:unnamed protein product, partial [Strongylus vulgaris]